MGKKTKLIHVQDIASLYSNTDMINKFRGGIRFSSIGHEEDVVLEPCLGTEMANMDTSMELFAPYFISIHLLSMSNGSWSLLLPLRYIS